jgi:hypothetical protein
VDNINNYRQKNNHRGVNYRRKVIEYNLTPNAWRYISDDTRRTVITLHSFRTSTRICTGFSEFCPPPTSNLSLYDYRHTISRLSSFFMCYSLKSNSSLTFFGECFVPFTSEYDVFSYPILNSEFRVLFRPIYCFFLITFYDALSVNIFMCVHELKGNLFGQQCVDET